MSRGKSQRLRRKAAVWGGVGLALAGSVLAMAVVIPRSGRTPQAVLLLDAVGPEDWRRGDGQAEVLLVEYGDYQCPPCARYHLLIERAMSEYGTRIAFVYRHFPLRKIHPYAELAALAAEAAGRQGRYWDMHTLLYRRQKEWAGTADSRRVFDGYASLLGLDLPRFAADLADPALLGEVERDYQSGLRAKVDATPTLFLQGKKVPFASSYVELRALLEEALSHAGVARS
jgi:protein-disulfide isomerase